MKKQKLGTVLRHARMSQGLTLMDIQKKSRGRISSTVVGLIETGKHRKPKPESLRVIAEVLKLNFVGLMLISGNLTSDDVDMIITQHMKTGTRR